MSVWLTIPSARPVEEAEKVLKLWRAQGYKIALLRDEYTSRWCETLDHCIIGVGKYPGYAMAVNTLVSQVMAKDPQAEWFVIGGDDVEPDMAHTADQIGEKCCDHFLHLAKLAHMNQLIVEEEWETFGVMQPTGDRFAEGSIDRICGSAWLGREFCRRINQGRGPLWPEYIHNFVDEELQNVAIKYGIFQQRRDLIHLHHHFMRENDNVKSPAVKRETPAHLKHAFSPEGWGPYKKIFDTRKALGFPGSEPIA